MLSEIILSGFRNLFKIYNNYKTRVKVFVINNYPIRKGINQNMIRESKLKSDPTTDNLSVHRKYIADNRVYQYPVEAYVSQSKDQ